MPRLQAVALLFLAFLPLGALAERPTERSAPLQLGVAQQSLDRARMAAAADPRLAAVLARQAELDARLAWGMTDSAVLRNGAARVAGDSARLLRALGVRAEPRAAAE